MLQYKEPEDWVLATGETHTVKEFAEKAFSIVGLNYEDYVELDDKFQRPNEVHHLLGDPSRAKSSLGWELKTSFNELINMMVESDVEIAKKEKILIKENLLEPTWSNPVID